MSRWLIPTFLVLLGTVLAAGAGWSVNTVAASFIAPAEGELPGKYERVARAKPEATSPNPSGSDTAEPSATTTAPPTAQPNVPSGLSRKDYVDAIVKRSIFDSTKVGGSSEAGCEGEGCEGERSDLPFTLLATLVAIPEERSSALLLNENSKEAWGYSVGARLLDATILSIEFNKVTVQRGDGSREFITVTGQGENKIADGGAETESAGSTNGEISQISETEFEVSRSLIERYMGDMSALAKLGRARPHNDESGNPDGFRLSGVRRNEPLYQLGIRSGDVIHSVNGKPLTDTVGAVSALQQLQNGSDFQFEVTRRGQKQTMSYRVK